MTKNIKQSKINMKLVKLTNKGKNIKDERTCISITMRKKKVQKPWVPPESEISRSLRNLKSEKKKGL